MPNRSKHKANKGSKAGQYIAPDNNDRVRVTQLAAKFVAEGLTDLGAAKRKAARQLGYSEKNDLPDHAEIEEATRHYMALFHGETQPKILAQLRQTSLHCMQWLESFHPWLTGAVLKGTANEYSDIEIELVGVDTKSFDIFLLNQNVEFDVVTGPSNKDNLNLMHYRVEFEGIPVKLTFYESQAQRATSQPKGGMPRERLQRSDATKYFAGALQS